MTQHEIRFSGCTPEPLLNYLKALGVIRIISEQKDPNASWYWEQDQLVAKTRLDRNQLVEFFLQEYQPTPILSPWNGGSGFYRTWDPKNKRLRDREAVEALQQIERSTNSRLADYREQIAVVRDLLSTLARVLPPEALKDSSTVKQFLVFPRGDQICAIPRNLKAELVAHLRRRLTHEGAMAWVDAAWIILSNDEAGHAPLLGTGGNVGNSEFSARFMQFLCKVLPLAEDRPPPDKSRPWLVSSLFGEPTLQLPGVGCDYFAPGSAGGPNMTAGFEGQRFANPWDFVLMIEGILFFRGAAARRFLAGLSGLARVAVFPFMAAGGRGGLHSEGLEQSHGEVWLPLWSRPAGYRELGHLFAEGRADVGRRRAVVAVDFARAIAMLGVDRGIDSFVRYALRQRFGDNLLAIPCARYRVELRSASDALADLERWLDALRAWASGKGNPESVTTRLRKLVAKVEDGILTYCHSGRREDLESLFTSIGHGELVVAKLVVNARSSRKKGAVVKPLSLSERWIRELMDGSPEFRIAAAIASIGGDRRTADGKQAVGPLRTNVEPVQRTDSGWDWADVHTSVVWRSGSLASNLAAVLERRLIDGVRAGTANLPLASHRPARLSDIARWLWDESGDARIVTLIPSLALIEPGRVEDSPEPDTEDDSVLELPLPRAYALLKLMFLPRPLVPPLTESDSWKLAWKGEEGIRIRPDLRIISLLKAGRVSEACQIACQRLRAVGLVPMPGPLSSGRVRDHAWADATGVHPRRLLASLLIPINTAAINKIVRLVSRPHIITGPSQTFSTVT